MKPVNFQDEILNPKTQKTEEELVNEIQNPSIELAGKIQQIAMKEYRYVNSAIDALISAAAKTALYGESIEDLHKGLKNEFSRPVYSIAAEFDPLDPSYTPEECQLHEELIRKIINKYNLLGQSKKQNA